MKRSQKTLLCILTFNKPHHTKPSKIHYGFYAHYQERMMGKEKKKCHLTQKPPRKTSSLLFCLPKALRERCPRLWERVGLCGQLSDWPHGALYTPCTICDVTHQPPAESALTACIKTLTYNSLLIFHEDLFLTRSNHCLKMPNIFS